MSAREGGTALYEKMAQELWRLAQNATGIAERHACTELAKQYDRLAQISSAKGDAAQKH